MFYNRKWIGVSIEEFVQTEDGVNCVKQVQENISASPGGGSFFGKAGSFEDGYEFDAVVLDDSSSPHPQPLTIYERLQRLFYLGLDRTGIKVP